MQRPFEIFVILAISLGMLFIGNTSATLKVFLPGEVAGPGDLSNGNDTKGNKTEIVNEVMIITTWGNIRLGLYDIGAPITTSNFINLTESSFYNGIKFHRIIDDFVIQTGDPNTKNNNLYDDGWGGSGKTIPLEVDPELTHIDGAVGMARSSEPDSASSQFYICDGPQHGLDGNYAVFGVVTEGMDTVRKIAKAETYGNTRPLLKDHPIEDIVMRSVTVVPLNDTDDGSDGSFLETFQRTNPVGFGGVVFGLAGLVIAIFVFILLVKFGKRLATGRRRREDEDVYEVEPIQEPGDGP